MKTNKQNVHLQEPCLPCLSVSLKCLCLCSKETSWPGLPVNGCRKEEMNTSPLLSGGNQEIFVTTYSFFFFLFFTLSPHHPLLVSWNKLTFIIEQDGFSGHSSVIFTVWCFKKQNKTKHLTIPCPNISFLIFLACCVASGLSNNQTTKSTSKVGGWAKGQRETKSMNWYSPEWRKHQKVFMGKLKSYHYFNFKVWITK